MSGSILQASISDAKRIITKGGFEETITISTPSGDLSLEITGLASKHHLSFNTDGSPVSSKNAHACVSETELTALGYPVRNPNGEIDFRQHKISFIDSSGVKKHYAVRETFPDETLGLITLILGDWQS